VLWGLKYKFSAMICKNVCCIVCVDVFDFLKCCVGVNKLYIVYSLKLNVFLAPFPKFLLLCAIYIYCALIWIIKELI
jgi:hypothetical protein